MKTNISKGSVRLFKKSRQHPGRGPAAGHALINEMRDEFSVGELCEALEISRSGYYKDCNRKKSEREHENNQLIEEMETIHTEKFKRAYGSPRMTTELHVRGFHCSENRVARLMSKNGLRAKHKSSFRPKTTVQNPERMPAPNRLARKAAPTRPGEVFISDITYVATAEGWIYLAVAVTLVLFSRQVAG